MMKLPRKTQLCFNFLPNPNTIYGNNRILSGSTTIQKMMKMKHELNLYSMYFLTHKYVDFRTIKWEGLFQLNLSLEKKSDIQIPISHFPVSALIVSNVGLKDFSRILTSRTCFWWRCNLVVSFFVSNFGVSVIYG